LGALDHRTLIALIEQDARPDFRPVIKVKLLSCAFRAAGGNLRRSLE
jgi:hypothetical protein